MVFRVHKMPCVLGLIICSCQCFRISHKRCEDTACELGQPSHRPLRLRLLCLLISEGAQEERKLCKF